MIVIQIGFKVPQPHSKHLGSHIMSDCLNSPKARTPVPCFWRRRQHGRDILQRLDVLLVSDLLLLDVVRVP